MKEGSPISEIEHHRAIEIGERRRTVAAHWVSLLKRIRATAGFEQFLHPPGIDRLHRQAAGGPIVTVYSSRWGSGALLVTTDPEPRVRVVPLPDLTPATVAQRINRQ
jgi:hypothetical protein